MIYLFCLVQATQSTHIAEAIVKKRITRVFMPLPRFDRVIALLNLVSLFNYKKDGMIWNVAFHCFFAVFALANAKMMANESPIGNSSTFGTCGLYLAESSIPGGGIGMYTGQSLGPEASAGPSDVCHFLIGTKIRETIFSRYVWKDYVEDAGSSQLCPSYGSVANGHYSMYNIWQAMATQSDANLHRKEGHGAGSFTLFHDVRGIISKPVDAGEELFMNYGAGYFKNRPEYKDLYYQAGSFDVADSFLSSIISFEKNVTATDARKGTETRAIKFIKDMLGEDTSAWARIAKLIPDTFEESRAVIDAGGAARNQLQKSIRSGEWLEEHGSCIDNLKPGMSEKKERGRGALATRSIKKGDVVVMSPLLYVFRDKLEYSFSRDDHTKVNMTEQIINYCFGHPESPVLLWPYAPVVNLINHDRASSNVLVRWADNRKQPVWWMDKEKRRQVIANDTTHYGGSGLMLEFVASRDIAEDEEVLLNYGEAWERAWEQHSELWSPPVDAGNYTAAHVFDDKTQHPVLRTVEEQDENPYPSNVDMKCMVRYTRPLNPYEDVLDEDAEESIVETNFVWEHPIADLALRELGVWPFLRPCRILARVSNSLSEQNFYNYTIEVLNGESQERDSEIRPYERVIAAGLPRSAFRFLEKRFFADVYIEDAFRMPMAMGDDQFPDEWKSVFLPGK